MPVSLPFQWKFLDRRGLQDFEVLGTGTNALTAPEPRYLEKMMSASRIFSTLYTLCFALLSASFLHADAPSLYGGRIRPHSHSLQHWSETFAPKIEDEIWRLHLLGVDSIWDHPLLEIHSDRFIQLLQLSPGRSLFSPREVTQALYTAPNSARHVAHLLIISAVKRNLKGQFPIPNRPISLDELAAGLTVTWTGSDLIPLSLPSSPPWHHLELHRPIASLNADQLIQSSATETHLVERIQEAMTSLSQIKNRADGAFLLLIDREGRWHPLRLLLTEPSPALPYNRRELSALSSTVGRLKLTPTDPDLQHQLYTELETAYRSLLDKEIPTVQPLPAPSQLRAEEFYRDFPLTSLTIALYLLSIAAALHNRWKNLDKFLFLSGWGLHLSILLLRCYILGRPPVSNMLETYLYVSWITSTLTLFAPLFSPSRTLSIAGAALSAAILAIGKAHFPQQSLDPTPAVLNSQFWLTCHVLLIVGSYGILALLSALGHLYLFSQLYYRWKKSPIPLYLGHIGAAMHTLLYTGTATLVIGTLLGGVWAAQSWGRFWDWDPKEAWAFIACCIYLIIVHNTAMRRIGNWGLAVGAIVGFLVISFTWYGVNYILGTGLHSYGFGDGAHWPYFLFVGGEFILLMALAWRHWKHIGGTS